MLYALSSTLSWVVAVIATCWIIDRETRCSMRFFHAVRSEALPFAWLLLAVIAFLQTWDGETVGTVLNATLSALYYWIWRADKHHDDRWKRRRRRALEHVQSLGHRLVVVPAPA